MTNEDRKEAKRLVESYHADASRALRLEDFALGARHDWWKSLAEDCIALLVKMARRPEQPAQVPMTEDQIYAWADATQFRASPLDFARAIEAHHGIGGGES